MLVDVSALTPEVMMTKLAAVSPWGTVMLAGTLTDPLALDSETPAPPAGAAPVSVTVPVDALPPMTDAGLAAIAASATPAAAGFHPRWITSKSLAERSENAGFRMSLFQRGSN